jgi:hypothetical protein
MKTVVAAVDSTAAARPVLDTARATVPVLLLPTNTAVPVGGPPAPDQAGVTAQSGGADLIAR